jgi:hypothetical protein
MQPLLNEATLPVEAQPFTLVDDYTTFSVEYTKKGESDVHFHFFLTPELESKKPTEMNWYWNEEFPKALDKTARAFFGFEYPRIQASLITGVLRSDDATKAQDSWWMIVQQLEADAFPIGDNVDDKISRFLSLLDQALESSSNK